MLRFIRNPKQPQPLLPSYGGVNALEHHQKSKLRRTSDTTFVFAAGAFTCKATPLACSQPGTTALTQWLRKEEEHRGLPQPREPDC